jgi:hypothetical protein
MPSLNYFDKDKQEWVAIPLGGGTVDTAGLATEQFVIDAIAGKADQSEFSQFQGQYGTLESEFREYFRLLNQGFATVAQKPDVDAALDLKADTTTVSGLSTTLMNSIMEVKDGTYTKPEVDEAIAGAVSGQLTPEQITEIISQVGPVDLSTYAKVQDSDQQLLAKTVVAQAVGFGGSAQPPVALAYTDSGEGYGNRLVLNMGLTNEYIVYKSDLDTLFPAIDTSQFTTTVTAAALDTRIKSLESKSAATSNINDASNTALKKSILDAVALMIAGGGSQPPADIGWTPCRSENLSGNHPTAQARMIAGVIELRGIVAVNNLSINSFFTHLPSSFPLPELDIYVPVGARLNSGPAVAAFVTIDKSTRRIGFIAGSTISELHLTGVRVKAAY